MKQKVKQSECTSCDGAGGRLVSRASSNHDDYQEGWLQCGLCLPDRIYRQYELEQGPFLPAKD